MRTDVITLEAEIFELQSKPSMLEGLICLQPGVEVVGASSDHLIVDVTNSEILLSVGDRLHFSMSYGGNFKRIH